MYAKQEYSTAKNFENAVGLEREVEYGIMLRVTRDLKQSFSRKDGNFSEFIACLQRNRNLWEVFLFDIAAPTNMLPNDLKAKLFSLGEFVLAHTRMVVNGQADAQVLIDINLSVLRGLAQGGTSR